MALETWLIKVKETISNSKASKHKKPNFVGVLSFEIAGLMSKLLQLWNCLSDKNMIRLRHESMSLEGIRKIVSNDESFLLGLACAEMAENLRLVSNSISRMSSKCRDPNLRCFDRWFDEFANSGHDSHGWVLSSRDMEAKKTKMDKYVTITVTLYKEMVELTTIENSFRKSFQFKEHESSTKEQKIVDLQQKLFWQKQEIKYLKERSLWNKSFDEVVPMLVRTTFTILGRMKLVFGFEYPPLLPRSLSTSATVHPIVSGPSRSCSKQEAKKTVGFFESNSKVLRPPPCTLGGAGLALHYANLIIVMEKMIKSLHSVGPDSRDDLYSMLPSSIRSTLGGRLKGVGFSASDPVLAGEWRAALRNIMGWLSPLAHNMIKWQSERSFEHQNLLPKTNVLHLQSLYFADKEKTEAAITELLVGLNYIWRFEREMTAKALFECSNFNGLLNSQSCR
ncbi:aminotransferase ACS12-like [Hibiscus syriacus]|uniref:Aminotransferase ACS12-like n=1 Tax=Hibiscus syriacus TaxID=106335 RepID=A0A6A3BXM1_HIBSY|nr:protein PSK SIMULATOR 1-like [Hibiscus syriacus]KAE8719732.1 aminotransferase ACS12-like [Hibiscus syriacus]